MELLRNLLKYFIEKYKRMKTDIAVVEKKGFFESFVKVTIFFLFLSAVLLYLHHRWEGESSDLHFLGVVAKETGFACLVAVLLNLSIEGVNRRRHHDLERSLAASIDEAHQKRIGEVLSRLESEHQQLLKELGAELEQKHMAHRSSLLADLDKKYNETTTNLLKDVFRTVYERYIEEGIFKVIDNHILKKDVMRKGYKASLAIHPLGGKNPDDQVKLCFAQSYRLVNLTDREITVPIIMAVIDVTPAYEHECRFINAKIGDRDYDADELAQMIKKDEENSLWQIVIPGTLHPRESVNASLRYDKVGPKTYSEVVVTTIQMDGLEMETTSFVDELAVTAVSLHPDDAVCRPHELIQQCTAWKIDHAILPGQGIVAFWHKKRGDQGELNLETKQALATAEG